MAVQHKRVTMVLKTVLNCAESVLTIFFRGLQIAVDNFVQLTLHWPILAMGNIHG